MSTIAYIKITLPSGEPYWFPIIKGDGVRMTSHVDSVGSHESPHADCVVPIYDCTNFELAINLLAQPPAMPLAGSRNLTAFRLTKLFAANAISTDKQTRLKVYRMCRDKHFRKVSSESYYRISPEAYAVFLGYGKQLAAFAQF